MAERKHGRPRRLWWRLPGECAGALAQVAGDPFVPALLPLCMVAGERLRIEAAVSPALVGVVAEIQAIYSRWLPHAREIALEAAVKHPGQQAGAAVGCFFSGGVDSFYSLLKNDELPTGDSDRLTHLLFVAGFDLSMAETALLREVRAHLRQVAGSTGRRYLEVQTNLRAHSDRLLSWELYHGAALAAVGLACGSMFKKILIPSSFSREQLHPWGSHPDLDPLWSTENTSIIHDGSEVTRIEKILNAICRSEPALQHLRVCWKNYHHRYNCSICEKCLRTMIALHIGSGAVVFPTFARPLTVEKVRRLRLDTESKLIFARENERALASLDGGFDRGLAAALREAIERGQARRGPGRSGPAPL